MSFEDVQREYDLTVEDIRAALKFASELIEREEHHPLPGWRASVRFLVDASLPRSGAPRLRQIDHDAVDVRDIGMRSATDGVIAVHARVNRLALITRDVDFADIRNYPPSEYAGIVVLRLMPPPLRSWNCWRGFVRREDWLARLPGRLAIVEPTRARFRPAWYAVSTRVLRAAASSG
jgi:predicted nucleic acid-binding protein